MFFKEYKKWDIFTKPEFFLFIFFFQVGFEFSKVLLYAEVNENDKNLQRSESMNVPREYGRCPLLKACLPMFLFGFVTLNVGMLHS